MPVLESIQAMDIVNRRQKIVDTLVEAFADLMSSSPDAFRIKFRKMAADPFAFYRGSVALFYADLAVVADPWVTEDAIARAVGDRDDEFAEWLCQFAREYADVVRDDHRRFVDGFRRGEIPGVQSTTRLA